MIPQPIRALLSEPHDGSRNQRKDVRLDECRAHPVIDMGICGFEGCKSGHQTCEGRTKRTY